MTRAGQLLTILTSLVMAQPASAQSLTGDALVKALREGGYVIVMRHASSPREVPNKQTANPDNVKLERQLDEAGRAGSSRWDARCAISRFPLVKYSPAPHTARSRPCAWHSLPIHERKLNSVMAARACRALQMLRLRGSAIASLTCLPEQTQSS
jgi:hypothetical protein